MTFISGTIISMLFFSNLPLSTSFPVEQPPASGVQDNAISHDLLNKTESVVLPDDDLEPDKPSQVFEENIKKSSEVAGENNAATTAKGSELNFDLSKDENGTPSSIARTKSYSVTIFSPSQGALYNVTTDGDNKSTVNLNMSDTSVTDEEYDSLPFNSTGDDTPSMTLPSAYRHLLYDHNNETKSTYIHNKTMEDILNRLYNESYGDKSYDEDDGTMLYDFRISPVDEDNEYYDNFDFKSKKDGTPDSSNIESTDKTETLADELPTDSSVTNSIKDVSMTKAHFTTMSARLEGTTESQTVDLPSENTLNPGVSTGKVIPSTNTQITTAKLPATQNVLLSTSVGTSTPYTTVMVATKSSTDTSKVLPTKAQIKHTETTRAPTTLFIPTPASPTRNGSLSTRGSSPQFTQIVTIHALFTKLDKVKESLVGTPTPPTPPSVNDMSSPPTAPTPPLPPTLPKSVQPPSSTASSLPKTAPSAPPSLSTATTLPPVLPVRSSTVVPPTPPSGVHSSTIPSTQPDDLVTTTPVTIIPPILSTGSSTVLPPTLPADSQSSPVTNVVPTPSTGSSTVPQTLPLDLHSSSLATKVPPIPVTLSSTAVPSSPSASPSSILPPTPPTVPTSKPTILPPFGSTSQSVMPPTPPPLGSTPTEAQSPSTQSLPETQTLSTPSVSSRIVPVQTATPKSTPFTPNRTSNSSQLTTLPWNIPLNTTTETVLPIAPVTDKSTLSTSLTTSSTVSDLPSTLASTATLPSKKTSPAPQLSQSSKASTTLPSTSQTPASSVTPTTSRITLIVDLPKTLPSKTKPSDEESDNSKLTSFTPPRKPWLPTKPVTTNLPTTTTTGRRVETKHHENVIIPVTHFRPETTTRAWQIVTKPGHPDEGNAIFHPTNEPVVPPIEPVPTKKPVIPNVVTDDLLPELYVTFTLRMTWQEFCEHRVQFKSFLLRLLKQDKQQMHQQYLSELDSDFPYQIVFPGTSEHCKPGKHKVKRATDHIMVSTYVADYKGRYNKMKTEKLYSLVTVMSLNDVFFFDGQVQNIKLQGMAHQTAVTEPVPQDKSLFGPGLIIGICLGSLTMVFIILFITLKTLAVKKKSRVKQMRYCEEQNGIRASAESLAEQIQLGGVHGRERFAYCNPNLIMNSLRTTNPSNVLNKAGLAQMVFDDELIEEEFMLLPHTMPKISEVPIGAEDKNRFANVIPARHTRVYLRYVKGEEHSDYFNGNFVRGFDGNPKFYIATQAPLESTRPDFWRMVWEQRCQVIIMLTQLDENGLSKCAEYWPNTDHADKVRVFGDYEVILQRRQVKPYWIISTLILKELERNLCREVHHIWFLVWPEQALPPSPVVISFLGEVWDYTHDSESPIVVHCCPGTGRTGTLIAIDTCMRQYAHSKMVDILQCVYNLRHDRAGAVQTKQQYAFIYETLQDFAEYRSRTPSRASSIASGIHH